MQGQVISFLCALDVGTCHFPMGTPFEIVLLDRGQYFELDHATRSDFCLLWSHLTDNDAKQAANVARKMCNGDDNGARWIPRVLHRRMARWGSRTLTAFLEAIQVHR